MERKSLQDFGALFLRVSISILMLVHGIPKLNMLLSGNADQFADPIGLGSTFSLILVVGAEFFCSIMLILGAATRLFTIPLIINMSVAAFVAHMNDPFQQKELAVIYLIIYIAIAFIGAGKYSVDGYLIARSNCKGIYKYL